MLVMSDLYGLVSPLERRLKGCVTVRGVGWAEMFLLLFGEVVSVRFWVTTLEFRRLCADVTHPPPLSRGEIEMMFSSW